MDNKKEPSFTILSNTTLVNFVPLKGEIIVYSFSSGQPRIKIGDGATTVGNLAFVDKVYADHVAATNIHYTVSVDTANELLKFTTAS